MKELLRTSSQGMLTLYLSYLLCRIGFSLNFFRQSLNVCSYSHYLKSAQIKQLTRIYNDLCEL